MIKVSFETLKTLSDHEDVDLLFTPYFVKPKNQDYFVLYFSTSFDCKIKNYKIKFSYLRRSSCNVVISELYFANSPFNDSDILKSFTTYNISGSLLNMYEFLEC